MSNLRDDMRVLRNYGKENPEVEQAAHSEAPEILPGALEIAHETDTEHVFVPGDSPEYYASCRGPVTYWPHNLKLALRISQLVRDERAEAVRAERERAEKAIQAHIDYWSEGYGTDSESPAAYFVLRELRALLEGR